MTIKNFNQRGFTLLETVIYIFVSCLILLGLISFASTVTSMTSESANTAKLSQQTQEILTKIKNDMERANKIEIISGSMDNVKNFTIEDTKDYSLQGILLYPKISYNINSNKQLERKEGNGKSRVITSYTNNTKVDKLQLVQQSSNLWMICIQMSARKGIKYDTTFIEKTNVFLPNI